MSIRGARLPVLAALLSSALIVGSDSAGADTTPAVSLVGAIGQLGGVTLGVQQATVATVTGQVSVFPFNPTAPLTPVPWLVYKDPSGCTQLPLLAHIILNTTNAPVDFYPLPGCDGIPEPIPPGTGVHVEGAGSWEADPVVDAGLSVGPISVGAAVTAPVSEVAPDELFVSDDLPIDGYDGESGCTTLPPPPLAHALFNDSDTTITAYLDPDCTVTAGEIVIPPGDGVHVIGYQSFADTAPAAAAPAPAKKAVSARTTSCTRSTRVRTRARRTASTRVCKTTRRPARTDRHA